MATSVVGFDIGNLGSKIGVARNRGIDVIVNEVSNRSTPSLVGFGPRTRTIGEAAKTAETSNFRNTIGSLKRLVGRAFGDPDIAAHEARYINAELVDVHGQVGFRVDYLGEPTVFTATQVYAMLLGKLRDTTANETKAPVNDVVIAIPGWYTDRQRRAVKDAAEIAGLHALQLVNDTTATAFGYGIAKSDLPEPEAAPRIVAFVDIGHSDYSVSIAAFRKGQVEIKGTAYDPNFGGRDIDYALCEHFAEEFKGKYKIDVLSNKKATFRLATAVEKLKKILSANAQAPLSVESIMNDIDASSSLSRDDFEQLVAPLLERTVKPLEDALAAAGLTKDQIDIVELVGGSTRMPALKNRIQAFFGKGLSMTTNQDEAIARGATFLCASLSPVFRVREFKIVEQQARPIEISWEEESGKQNEPLVAFPAGSTYPSVKTLSIYQSSDFNIEVQYSPAGAWIARATIKGVKPDAAGESQQTKVKVGLDASGIFDVRSAQIVEDAGEEEAAAPAADAAPSAEGGEAMETEAPAAKKPRKTKRRDLTVIAGSSSLNTSLVNEQREREGQMHSSDKLVKETEDRKNALEEYIYEARDKIESAWAPFGNANTKSALRTASEEAENWLYSEEGEDATKSAYTAKLDELKKLGDPMAFRYREHDERPRALRALNETLGTLLATATSGDEKISHLSEDELQKVIEKVATTQKWLDDQSARQSERTKDQDPAMTSAEIKKRQDEVLLFCTPILSKPKPKPKTEAPPPPQANADQQARGDQGPPPPSKDDAPMDEGKADLAEAEGAEVPEGGEPDSSKIDGMDID